ncbi:MAG: hypothetical protein ACXWCY_30425 [Burkholderiales bacterium]
MLRSAMFMDLVPIWTVILAVAVFMYVLLDGFDLVDAVSDRSDQHDSAGDRSVWPESMMGA